MQVPALPGATKLYLLMEIVLLSMLKACSRPPFPMMRDVHVIVLAVCLILKSAAIFSCNSPLLQRGARGDLNDIEFSMGLRSIHAKSPLPSLLQRGG